MSERTHHRSQHRVVAASNLNPRHGYCVPTAWARALARDPADIAEVARIFPAVVRKLRASGRLRRGTYTTSGGVASMEQAARTLGFREIEVRREELDRSKTGWVDTGWMRSIQHRVRQGYPTLAQWARRNPDVRRAVLRGTGHAGYFTRAADGTVRVFDMGARKRIDHAVILDRAEAPADLAALANPAPAHEARGQQHKEITMSTHTKQELEEKTVAEIRDIAKGVGVESIDARRLADGKTPNKGHWIAAVLEAQGSAPAKPKAEDNDEPRESIWRLAVIVNPKTGRDMVVRCAVDGTLYKVYQQRTGITQIDEWVEVRATGHRHARDLIAEGEGETVTREAAPAEAAA